jgi:hypothetical protein
MDDRLTEQIAVSDPNGLRSAEAAMLSALTGADEEQPEMATEQSPEMEAAPEEEYGTDDLDDEQADDPDDTDGDQLVEEELEDPTEPTYTVKVSGQELEIPLSELLNGYSRNADYTQKSQRLADERRQLMETQSQLAELQEQIQQWQSTSRQADDFAVDDPGPDYWSELKTRDPVRYMIERDDYREKVAQRDAHQRQTAELQQQLLQQQHQQRAYRLEEQKARMLELIPEIADPDRGAGIKAGIKAYGAELGYTDEELDSLEDARAVKVLHDAWQWQQLQQRRQMIKARPSQSLSSGPSQSSATGNRGHSQLTKAKQRLAKTGTVRDATAAFTQLLSKR